MNNSVKEVKFTDKYENSVDKSVLNKSRIEKALQEFIKHPYADLTISKHSGVIKSFRINLEVRFDPKIENKNG